MAELLRLPRDSRYNKDHFYGHYYLIPTDTQNVFTVDGGTIRAPKRGVEIMEAIIHEFKSIASERSITIIHNFEPEHAAALNLIRLFANVYVPTQEEKNGNQLFKHTYTP